jgi:hypothetical protein
VEKYLLETAITPIQLYGYTTGKNTTDLACEDCWAFRGNVGNLLQKNSQLLIS